MSSQERGGRRGRYSLLLGDEQEQLVQVGLQALSTLPQHWPTWKGGEGRMRMSFRSASLQLPKKHFWCVIPGGG